MKKKSELRLDFLVGALTLIMILLTVYWYFNALDTLKMDAYEKIDALKEPCDVLAKAGVYSDCDLTVHSYSLTEDVLCGSELNEELENLKENIKGTFNLWKVKRLAQFRELHPAEAMDYELETYGEIFAGNRYFASTQNLKLKILFNTDALSKPCNSSEVLLREFAYCDLSDIKKILPSEPKPLAKKFLEKAENDFLTGDYLGTLTYTTAAIAYQDKISRESYATLVAAEEEGPLCLQ